MEKNWIEITDSNVPKHKVLVTNNIEARTATGQMSHVWVASVGVYKKSKGRFNAFIDLPGTNELWDITHYCEIPKP